MENREKKKDKNFTNQNYIHILKNDKRLTEKEGEQTKIRN